MRPSWSFSLTSASLFLALGVAGCSPKASPKPKGAAHAAPSSAVHNWRYRVGQDYAYEAEPAAGQAKPVVQVYRYLGEHDGVFALRTGGDTMTCANPCETITVHTGLFHVERVAFDPDSLVGAALTDAFNGQLDAYEPGK